MYNTLPYVWANLVLHEETYSGHNVGNAGNACQHVVVRFVQHYKVHSL